MPDARRRAAGLAASAWGVVVFLTDCLPPRVRYGYVHRLTAAVLRRPLPTLRAADDAPERPSPASASPAASETDSGTDRGAPTVCLLAADGLDVGGIGTVIEMLARGLDRYEVRPIVLCRGDGERAARLRSAGIDVVSVGDEAEASAAIARLSPDVAQSHSASPFIERALLASGVPLIPVMHNTEIHYTPARWREFSALAAGSVAAIAVSATVRDFHLQRADIRVPVTVVPNGAPTAARPTAQERAAARTALSLAIEHDLGDAIVFVSLARYDAQKNYAGLVAAIAPALADTTPPVHLICAGDASDRVEVRRTDALRRSGPAADRIHLLGNSDARTLLSAADAFVLDSFFEGWPVAATEAMAFGHPVLLSDVGGARELVERDAGRSVLIANATGAADAVSDGRVRTARRRSRRQSNAAELREGVRRIAATVLRERSGGAAATGAADDERSGVKAMLAGHAAVIRAAAAHNAHRERG